MNGIRLHYTTRDGEPVSRDLEASTPDGLVAWTVPDDCAGTVMIEVIRETVRYVTDSDAGSSADNS